MSVYGYCPTCDAEVTMRTRGGPNAKDTCAKGHEYPSGLTLTAMQLALKKATEEEGKRRRDNTFLDYHASFTGGYL